MPACCLSLEGGTVTLPSPHFAADDFIHLEPGQFPVPLDEAALLVPLYGEASQLGALLLGRPTNGIHYRDDEVEEIMSMADRIGDAIHFAQSQSLYIPQIAQLAQEQPVNPAEHQNMVSVQGVETALRNLYDNDLLGDSPLGELKFSAQRFGSRAGNDTGSGKSRPRSLARGDQQAAPGDADTRRDPAHRVNGILT